MMPAIVHDVARRTLYRTFGAKCALTLSNEGICLNHQLIVLFRSAFAYNRALSCAPSVIGESTHSKCAKASVARYRV